MRSAIIEGLARNCTGGSKPPMVVTNFLVVRRRRLVPWLVAGALAGAIGIFGLSRWFMADQRLADAMAAADRDNPYWRLEDLMAHREQVPDAENSALVLAKVTELMPEEWPGLGAPGDGGEPAGKNTALDAYDQLQKLSAKVRPDHAVIEILRTELKAHEAALALARTVAGYKRGRHELVLAPILIETSLQETQATRRVARLLAADAALLAEDRNLDAALDSCRAILGTARSIGDEPTLVSAMARLALDSLAISSIQRVLGQGEPSDAALAQLEALILDENAQPIFLTAANSERAMLDELIHRVEEGKVPLSALMNGGTALRMISNVTGGFNGQRALALEWMNDAVAIARRPTFEQPALAAKWEAKIADVKRRRLAQFSAILPLTLMPAISAASSAFLRSRAELGATAILIAAERQRRRTGKWPVSIEEIDRDILAQAPADPYTGQPYHIERQDGQIVIYTFGHNGTDEHGADDPKLRYRGGPDDIGARAWDPNLRRQPALKSKP
jgi:hypothetical protein